MDLTKLNNKQLEAVCHIDSPMLVIAGAGSGKTFTMITRIAFMIEQGINPANILAVTFTNKAAKEMRERAESIVGEKANYATISTFHSFCSKFLRTECTQETKFKPNFTILDDKDSKKIIKENLHLIEQEKSKDEKEKVIIESYYSWICNFKSELIKPEYITAICKWLKNPLQNPPDLPKYVDFEKAIRLVRRIPEIYWNNLVIMYKIYQDTLIKNNSMDFESLISETIEMLIENDELLGKYQERYRYIIIDEYQDTNHSQYILTKLLAAKYQNIAVVGDDAQSIYAFRNADIRNILNFEKDYPNALVVKLEQNYRSTSNILDMANTVISHNLNQRKKELWTNLGEGHPVKYNVYQNTMEESEEIVKRIITLVHLGQYQYSDFTILYRINSQSRMLEDILIREKIPYDIVGGFSFYQRKEIKIICSYLNLLLNPLNDQELIEIINYPKRGIGESTINKCREYANVNNISLLEALRQSKEYLSPGVVSKIGVFLDIYDDLSEKKELYDVGAFIDCLIVDSGLEEFFSSEKDPEGINRLENIREFGEIAWEFQMSGGTLEEFIENIMINQQEFEKKKETGTKKVQLMTIHSAKGLEFPVVFMIGVEDNLLPYVKSKEEIDGLEEERRLCYVAITRAKERLYISRVIERSYYGEKRYNEPSIFLKEMGIDVGEEKKKGFNPFKQEV